MGEGGGGGVVVLGDQAAEDGREEELGADRVAEVGELYVSPLD